MPIRDPVTKKFVKGTAPATAAPEASKPAPSPKPTQPAAAAAVATSARKPWWETLLG